MQLISFSYKVKPCVQAICLAFSRRGKGKYSPSKIDTGLCTHIMYGFTVLHPSEYTIKTHDPWADIDNGESHGGGADHQSGHFVFIGAMDHRHASVANKHCDYG